MNAAVVNAFDAPPRYAQFADPVAADGEAVITVTAAGLHQVVKLLASGGHYASAGVLPFIPGVDGVGRLEDGTRVYFGASKAPFGSFAERCVTARFMCWPIAEALDDATVAAMMNPGVSSWAALTARAQFVAEESVLILGATGIAGKLAVQIAKRLGARRVVAAGRNAAELDKLQGLGADAIISLNLEKDALVSAFRDELATNKIDVVLDYVWGAPAASFLEAVSGKSSRGVSRIRFVQIGSLASPTISLPAAVLRSSAIELLGSGLGSASMDKIFRALSDFLAAAASAPFQVNVKTAPLSEIGALWDAPQPDGRLVFQP